jgi:hypothetical protein
MVFYRKIYGRNEDKILIHVTGDLKLFTIVSFVQTLSLIFDFKLLAGSA